MPTIFADVAKRQSASLKKRNFAGSNPAVRTKDAEIALWNAPGFILREKEVRLFFILYSTIPAERRGGSIELLLGSILEAWHNGTALIC